ncbi:hypothetical protein D9M68_685710 [compost metagenome]
MVGASHWNQRQGRDAELPGPKPAMFFAPKEAQQLIQQVGGQVFQQALMDRWQAFADYSQQWLVMEYGHGPAAVISAYQDVLKGSVGPRVGHLLSM